MAGYRRLNCLRFLAAILIFAMLLSACGSRGRKRANAAGQGVGVDAVVGVADAKNVLTVKNVRATPTKITGSLVNHSDKTLRDVQLMFQHAWLWKNERNPGKNNPSRTEFYQVLEDIPPNGTIAFEYRPQPPLPQRKDGQFETHVAVTSYSEVTR